jgi:hypothetical protein
MSRGTFLRNAQEKGDWVIFSPLGEAVGWNVKKQNDK